MEWKEGCELVRTGAGRPDVCRARPHPAVAIPDIKLSVLRLGYSAIPLVMGIDEYFNGLVYWPKYLADWIDNIAPGTAHARSRSHGWPRCTTRRCDYAANGASSRAVRSRRTTTIA